MQRAASAQQRSLQLSRDIEGMQQQLAATKATLQQLLPIKQAATVRERPLRSMKNCNSLKVPVAAEQLAEHILRQLR